MTAVPPIPGQRSAVAYGLGVAAVCVGCVLPWLDAAGTPVAAWDFGVLWVLTGRVGTLTAPPSAGAVALLGAVGLSWPLLARRRAGSTVAAAVAGLVIALASLSIVRAWMLADPGVPPSAGSVLALGGGIVAAVAAVVASGD